MITVFIFIIYSFSFAQENITVEGVADEIVETWQTLDQDVQLYLVGKVLIKRFEDKLAKNKEWVVKQREFRKAAQRGRRRSNSRSTYARELHQNYLADLRKKETSVSVEEMCAFGRSTPWKHVKYSGLADMSDNMIYGYGKASGMAPVLFCAKYAILDRDKIEESTKKKPPVIGLDMKGHKKFTMERKLIERGFTRTEYKKMQAFQEELKNRINNSIELLHSYHIKIRNIDPEYIAYEKYLSEKATQIQSEIDVRLEERQILRDSKQGEQTETVKHQKGISQEQINNLKRQNDIAVMRNSGNSGMEGITGGVLRDSRTAIENLTPRESMSYTVTNRTKKWYLIHNKIVDLNEEIDERKDKIIQLVAARNSPEHVLKIPDSMTKVADVNFDICCSILKGYALFKITGLHKTRNKKEYYCMQCRTTGRGSLTNYIAWIPSAVENISKDTTPSILDYPICSKCQGKGHLKKPSKK